MRHFLAVRLGMDMGFHGVMRVIENIDMVVGVIVGIIAVKRNMGHGMGNFRDDKCHMAFWTFPLLAGAIIQNLK